jgi:hypothetical protein
VRRASDLVSNCRPGARGGPGKNLLPARGSPGTASLSAHPFSCTGFSGIKNAVGAFLPSLGRVLSSRDLDHLGYWNSRFPAWPCFTREIRKSCLKPRIGRAARNLCRGTLSCGVSRWAVDYLQKPVNPSEMKRIIRTHLRPAKVERWPQAGLGPSHWS